MNNDESYKHLAPAHRKFYQPPEFKDEQVSDHDSRCENKDSKELLHYINDSVIGREWVFSGPFGPRTALYCDYTASGRSLQFIEDYIQQEVLPEYGNTHTTTSVTSLQTTLFRHEARDIIRNAVNASEHDAVVFVGSGCTGAMHKLMHVLQLTQPPVVLVGPHEHHSVLLPWRDIGAHVVRVRQSCEGGVDFCDLRVQLQEQQGSDRQLIGCFSAASNVTGLLLDVDAVTVLLHEFGALAIWDYATAAPYVTIDMNPVTTNFAKCLVCKDAVLISPHKFVGGVQTPGILVMKKSLFKNTRPHVVGGGTVFFVRREAHRYLQEAEMREEGGTPAIVESVRAGLVMQLKEAVGAEIIMAKEHELCRQATLRLQGVPELVLLGPTALPRLAIFSFLVRHPPSGRYLHHNFVCTLLNDLFGLQTRGGCACAGPYAQDLLGINEELAKKYEDLLIEDSRLDRVHLRRYREYSNKEILRPGFARFNIPYFFSDAEVDFVLSALEMVAQQGWKLLPQYNFDPETGEWRHRAHQVFRDRKWLGHVSYSSGTMTHRPSPQVHKGTPPSDHKDCLQQAQAVFDRAHKSWINIADQSAMFDSDASSLRWFLLPSEAAAWGNNPLLPSIQKPPPFVPPSYPLPASHHAQQIQNRNCKTTVGSVQETTMGTVHGSVHETTLGTVHGSVHETTLGTVHGSVQETTLGTVQETTLGTSQETTLWNVQETTLGNVHETTLGTSQETTLENVQETTLGAEQGTVQKTPLGTVQETTLGTSQETTLGNVHETTLGNVQETTLGAVQGTVQTTPLGTVQETTLETSQETTLGNVHVTTLGTVQETTLGTSQETTLGTSQETTLGTSQETTLGTVKGGVQVTTLEIVQETTLGTVQETTLGAVQGSVRETTLGNEQGTAQETTLGNVQGSVQETTTPVAKVADISKVAEISKVADISKVAGGKSIWHCPPKEIMKPFLSAVEEFEMVRDGDRLLVCLSGGKDSLSLLHCVRQYQFHACSKGINFEFGAVTVDPQTPSYDPSPLKSYLLQQNVPYFYESQGIMNQAQTLPYECASICSFCSRMKRGRIYQSARENGYNVLAMGQHLDDLAESFLMSAFHNGALRTMKANYTIKEQDLRVVRPLVYVRECHLRKFAEEKDLPVIAENCPACFDAPKERHRMKQLLASQEVLHPKLFASLQSTLRPLMAISTTNQHHMQLKDADQPDTDDL